MAHQKTIPTTKTDLTTKQGLQVFNEQLGRKITELQNILQSAQRDIANCQMQIAFNNGKIELLGEMEKEKGKASPD